MKMTSEIMECHSVSTDCRYNLGMGKNPKKGKMGPANKKQFKRGLIWTVSIGLAVFLVSAILVAWDGLTDEWRHADVAVVMGTTVNPDGTPSRWLKTRLDKALEVYSDGIVSWIIVSGGLEDNGFYECSVMATYLESQGIPSSHLIIDNKGDDTYLTAQHTAEIMHQQGWSSVIVVSQFYHIPRVKLALHHFGIQTVYGAHAEWITGMAVIWLGREVMAYPFYLFRKY